MTAQQESSLGPEVLMEVANGMVRAQKEFFGKGPESAKAYVLDDLLIVAMRGGMTTAEKTMLEFGHPDQVRAFRQLFENEMTERLTGMVEKKTGRRVRTYQSQVLFDPDVVVEIFVLDESAATTTGASADSHALEEPSTSGPSR